MKRALLPALLLAGLIAGCGKAGSLLSQYDTDGVAYLAYTDIDTVCDTPELAEAGGDLLASLEDSLLLSFVVDSSIELNGELGGYDHLVITNPRWVERFADPGQLKPVSFDSLPEDMRDFLCAQMPVLTVDGSVLPEGTGLYEYGGGAFPAFPVNVTLGWAEPVEAERPLILLADRPAEVFRPESCLLPLTSSGNVLFSGGEDALRTALAESRLQDYGAAYSLNATLQEETNP